jgi:hypothetical protein
MLALTSLALALLPEEADMWRIANWLALIAALVSVVYALIPSLPLKNALGPYLLPVAVGLLALQGILVARQAERNRPTEAAQAITIPSAVKQMPATTIPSEVRALPKIEMPAITMPTFGGTKAASAGDTPG